MIYFVRTATIGQGQVAKAFEWAVKVSNLINGKFPGAKVQVLRRISGQISDISWMLTADSLAQIEELMAGIESDSEYQQLLAEGRTEDLFVTSSVRDSFLRTVP